MFSADGTFCDTKDIPFHLIGMANGVITDFGLFPAMASADSVVSGQRK